MNRETIQTEAAPGAIGPYSQAIEANGFVFCSGQIPADPATGELILDDITAATHRVIQNIEAVLTAAGLELSDVVKTTVFLKDMNDFGAVNAVYGEYFGEKPPARACVEAARLPRDVQVEIDAIAVAR